MATAEQALLQYEAGQQATAMTELTDSGDAITLESTAALWSGRSGYAPVVRPNGVLTGFGVTTHATNNTVTVAAGSLNLAGAVVNVAAGTLLATRPATAVAKVNSLTISSAGALAAVAGTDGATTEFSETRGAAGGPPFIPVGSVEIGQVRFTSNTSAAVLSSEILQVIGLHQERADSPLYSINYGPTVVGGIETKAGGSVSFNSTLPLIHTGSVPKKVYASFSAPIFTDVDLASDFVAPETTHSVGSTQIYGTTLGISSSTLGQGSFNAYLSNGVTDPLVVLKNSTLWFRFYPDRTQAPYILSQGKLGISRTFPAADNIVAACTISATAAALEVAS